MADVALVVLDLYQEATKIRADRIKAREAAWSAYRRRPIALTHLPHGGPQL